MVMNIGKGGCMEDEDVQRVTGGAYEVAKEVGVHHLVAPAAAVLGGIPGAVAVFVAGALVKGAMKVVQGGGSDSDSDD